MIPSRFLTVLSVTLVVALGLACASKQGPEAPAADAAAIQAAQSLPEGTNVLAALKQKDYETAVATLAKLQQTPLEGDQMAQLAILRAHVKDALLESAPTDPKAAEAINVFRAMTQGR